MMGNGKDNDVRMSAETKSGETVTMTGSGTSGKTQTSKDGCSVVQTDGDQVIKET